MATGTLKTPKRIFAVDANTGQVYIAGDLFVQSADKARNSWIVGDMIYAGSIIELADGAIVLNGQHGTVSVFDPDAPTSGTFTEISHGRVNQYVDGDLARSLTGVETGTCENDSWVYLTGRYTSRPHVIVSPQALQCFKADCLGQQQYLECRATSLEHYGSDSWRFKPLAELVALQGTAVIPGPANITVSEIRSSNPITYETDEVNTGDSTILIGCEVVLGGCVYERDAEIDDIISKYDTPYYSGTDRLVLPVFDYYQALMKARLCYKSVFASTWNYGSWSWERTLTYSQSGSVILSEEVPSGNYQVKVQIQLRAGTLTHGKSFRIEEVKTNQCIIRSFSIDRDMQVFTPVGTVSYLAVGQ